MNIHLMYLTWAPGRDPVSTPVQVDLGNSIAVLVLVKHRYMTGSLGVRAPLVPCASPPSNSVLAEVIKLVELMGWNIHLGWETTDFTTSHRSCIFLGILDAGVHDGIRRLLTVAKSDRRGVLDSHL